LNQPDLTPIHAALEQAQSARALGREDPSRPAALRAALGSLETAWSADCKKYMRRGPLTGRRNSPDPVRVAARERRSQIKALGSALNPTSGTPRQPEYPPINARAMWGYVNHAKGELRRLAREHEAMRKVLAGSRQYWWMRKLNDEAAELLDQLQVERRRLKLAWERYERRELPPHDTAERYADTDAYDELADDLATVRADAGELADELRASIRQRKPDPTVPPRTWTETAVVGATADYHARHGRLPRKQDLNTDSDLPPYTTVYRLFGERPMEALKQRVGAAYELPS
jgi:hypothetical protein